MTTVLQRAISDQNWHIHKVDLIEVTYPLLALLAHMVVDLAGPKLPLTLAWMIGLLLCLYFSPQSSCLPAMRNEVLVICNTFGKAAVFVQLYMNLLVK